MKKQNATRTRNIATDNLVKLAQSDLVAFAKRCELKGYNNFGNPDVAFSAGNRQTVKAVSYEGINAGGSVWLVPTYISWSFELDALNQAERIELANYKKQASQIEQLAQAGIIDDVEKALSAVLDIEHYYTLLEREGCKDVQKASFSTGEDVLDLVEVMADMLDTDFAY